MIGHIFELKRCRFKIALYWYDLKNPHDNALILFNLDIGWGRLLDRIAYGFWFVFTLPFQNAFDSPRGINFVLFDRRSLEESIKLGRIKKDERLELESESDFVKRMRKRLHYEKTK